MMFHLPYFNMPYSNRYSRYGYRYPYYSYGNMNSSINSNNTSNLNTTSILHNANSIHNKKNGSYKYNANNTNNYVDTVDNKDSINNKNENNSSNDSPLFQLFGINLYFDDILLICLIWFLYDEGVKDEELFIALILLLLS